MYFSLRVQKVVYFLSDNLDRPSSHFCVQPDSHYLAGRPSSHFCVQPDSHYCCGTYLPLIFLSVLSALSVPYSNTLVPVQLWFLYQYRYVTASNDFDNESTRFHETRCFSLIQTQPGMQQRRPRRRKPSPAATRSPAASRCPKLAAATQLLQGMLVCWRRKGSCWTEASTPPHGPRTTQQNPRLGACKATSSPPSTSPSNLRHEATKVSARIKTWTWLGRGVEGTRRTIGLVARADRQRR